MSRGYAAYFMYLSQLNLFRDLHQRIQALASVGVLFQNKFTALTPVDLRLRWRIRTCAQAVEELGFGHDHPGILTAQASNRGPSRL